MPTYDYRCRQCGETFELVCAMAERDERAVCPACGSREVGQVFGPVATSGRGAAFSPGHFVRQKGQKPRWVEPKR